MAYIGNTVQNQGFSPAVDYFNGDGTTVTFTLSRPVASVAQLTAVIENVIQNPSTAFTVSGSSITFTSAPPAGSNNIWVEYTSLVTTYAALSQDPTVIGDITATGGYSSTGDYGQSFVDGVIMDYVTGNARITTGASDAVTIYNGGTSSRTALMTLSAAGNVGIGTTSPVGALDVRGAITSRSSSTASANSAGFYAGGAYTGNRFLLANLDAVSGANNIYYGGGSGSYESATNHFFLTGSAGSLGNGTTRMVIDSSGRVTMPYQVAFSACGAATNLTTSAATAMAFSNLISTVVGSTRSGGYNTSTYRYTAPVTGLYCFTLIVYPNGGSGYTQYAPYKNGSLINTATDQFLITSSYSDSYMATGTIIIELTANDYVDMRPRSGYTAKYFGGHSVFSGYLIG
jgi:hypothetical protein